MDMQTYINNQNENVFEKLKKELALDIIKHHPRMIGKDDPIDLKTLGILAKEFEDKNGGYPAIKLRGKTLFLNKFFVIHLKEKYLGLKFN